LNNKGYETQLAQKACGNEGKNC